MSAVAPQIPAHDFDAIEAGTTATSAVKGRVRIPWRFIGGRALFYLFTLWAAITINFFLPRMMKGDAVSAYLARNRNVSPEAAEALRALLGLDTRQVALAAVPRLLGHAPARRPRHLAAPRHAAGDRGGRPVADLDGGTRGLRDAHRVRDRHHRRRDHRLASRQPTRRAHPDHDVPQHHPLLLARIAGHLGVLGARSDGSRSARPTESG